MVTRRDRIQAKRACMSGVAEMNGVIARGLDKLNLERRINTRRKKDFLTMPEAELRMACFTLCDRNDQLEHVLRQMLGTMQVSMSRGVLGAETLQELYDRWVKAA